VEQIVMPPPHRTERRTCGGKPIARRANMRLGLNMVVNMVAGYTSADTVAVVLAVSVSFFLA
jgi:hypothetical protein